MATILKLKLRDRSDIIRIPTNTVIEWLELDDEEEIKQRLYDYFSPIKKDKAKVHDKVFLENIINWTPVDEKTGRQKGLSLTELSRWIRLARKVNAIDQSKDGTISLANKDITMIMERLKAPGYKMTGLTQHFTEFLTNFLKTTHQWFDDFDPSKDDEDDEEKEPEPDMEIETSEDGREETKTVTA